MDPLCRPLMEPGNKLLQYHKVDCSFSVATLCQQPSTAVVSQLLGEDKWAAKFTECQRVAALMVLMESVINSLQYRLLQVHASMVRSKNSRNASGLSCSPIFNTTMWAVAVAATADVPTCWSRLWSTWMQDKQGLDVLHLLLSFDK